MKQIAAKCHQLKKGYGAHEARVEALRGVELEVKMGELLMITGPSGCGKTTLLSILTGILEQDSGSCLVFDEEINHLSSEKKTAFRKKNIGFIFQALHLIPSLTAIENASIPLLLDGIEKEKAFEKAKELLTHLGLGKRLEALPANMSGGEQQRVAICRGCIHSPKLIVCDEPTSTLDHATGAQVLKLFRKTAIDEGKALIVVTHDTRIYPFADRILEMEDGCIVGEVHNSHS